MSGRQGGKLKPLKAPKAKQTEETEEEKKFRLDQNTKKKELEAAKKKLLGKK